MLLVALTITTRRTASFDHKHRTKMDDELLDVIKSLLPDMYSMETSSKLSDEKISEIKRLVDAGASLSNIDALHIAAGHYKRPDLFNLLIDEYGLGIEDSDHDSLKSKPLHVAACLGNCEAIEILFARGADKQSRNSKGRTPLQEVKHSNRQMQRGGNACIYL